MDRTRETRASSPEQGHWVTRDGGRRVIAWANRPLLDDDGDVRYIVTSGLDVTERETATAELWALQGQLRDRLEELQRLAAEQAALRRVATLVASEPGSEDVFAAVTREASLLLGADSGLLLCYDDDHRTGQIVGRYSERPSSCPGASGPARRGHAGAEPLPARSETRLERFAELVALALASAEARNELAASRARLVEAGDTARRRLERDLHDGAQQRLVAVALAMRLARAKLDQDAAAATELLEQAGEQLDQGLEQLRELARGIHPALLTDRGLQPALAALASRAPFPVGLDVPSERFTHGVEVAIYYLVSEALTNAAKYAEPSTVCVTVAHADGALTAEIDDDGRGGADPAGGSGLRGLADRVEAFGGRLRIDSPPGRGTRIRVELPLR